MRYPLLLASLLKYMDGDSNPGEVRARDKVYQALGAMKEVASGVDDAKSSREVELKTELIASRMELHSVRHLLQRACSDILTVSLVLVIQGCICIIVGSNPAGWVAPCTLSRSRTRSE